MNQQEWDQMVTERDLFEKEVNEKIKKFEERWHVWIDPINRCYELFNQIKGGVVQFPITSGLWDQYRRNRH